MYSLEQKFRAKLNNVTQSMILNFSSYKVGLPSPKTITILLTTLAK